MSDIALTIDQINKLLQAYVIQALNLGAPASPTDPIYKKARIEWPAEGQPAWGITEDVVCIGAVLEDDPSDKQRDMLTVINDDFTVNEVSTYQRVWRVDFTVYGPNSFNNSRLIRSGLFSQINHDLFATSNLYLMTDVSQFRRVPENIQSQWWERVDLHVYFNEGVTEITTDQSVVFVEVLLNTKNGNQVKDITVSA